MPELPEVHSIVNGLNQIVKGKKIIQTQVFNSKIINGKSNIRQFSDLESKKFIKNTIGKTIKEVKRIGKIIILDFVENGGLVVHLKMTGQLIYSNIQDINKHSHVVFEIENGFIIYNDIRKFGYVNYFDSQNELDKYTKNLSIDPINDIFTLSEFKNVKNYKTEIKKIFLDQKIALGIGNIYSDEICFDAGVLPTKKCNDLSNLEIEKLYNSIIKILNKSIELGGSSISDYVLADGTKGSFQNHHKVYGRGNKQCYACGEILKKAKISGRATVFCRTCQG